MNRQGDTTTIYLDYTYDNEELADVSDLSDVILQLNSEGQSNALTFKLSGSTIILDNNLNKYYVKLTQAQSLALGRTIRYQVTIKLTGGDVFSSDIGSITVGELLRTSQV